MKKLYIELWKTAYRQTVICKFLVFKLVIEINYGMSPIKVIDMFILGKVALNCVN